MIPENFASDNGFAESECVVLQQQIPDNNSDTHLDATTDYSGNAAEDRLGSNGGDRRFPVNYSTGASPSVSEYPELHAGPHHGSRSSVSEYPANVDSPKILQWTQNANQYQHVQHVHAHLRIPPLSSSINQSSASSQAPQAPACTVTNSTSSAGTVVPGTVPPATNFVNRTSGGNDCDPEPKSTDPKSTDPKSTTTNLEDSGCIFDGLVESVDITPTNSDIRWWRRSGKTKYQCQHHVEGDAEKEKYSRVEDAEKERDHCMSTNERQQVDGEDSEALNVGAAEDTSAGVGTDSADAGGGADDDAARCCQDRNINIGMMGNINELRQNCDSRNNIANFTKDSSEIDLEKVILDNNSLVLDNSGGSNWQVARSGEEMAVNEYENLTDSHNMRNAMFPLGSRSLTSIRQSSGYYPKAESQSKEDLTSSQSSEQHKQHTNTNQCCYLHWRPLSRLNTRMEVSEWEEDHQKKIHSNSQCEELCHESANEAAKASSGEKKFMSETARENLSEPNPNLLTGWCSPGNEGHQPRVSKLTGWSGSLPSLKNEAHCSNHTGWSGGSGGGDRMMRGLQPSCVWEDDDLLAGLSLNECNLFPDALNECYSTNITNLNHNDGSSTNSNTNLNRGCEHFHIASRDPLDNTEAGNTETDGHVGKSIMDGEIYNGEIHNTVTNNTVTNNTVTNNTVTNNTVANNTVTSSTTDITGININPINPDQQLGPRLKFERRNGSSTEKDASNPDKSSNPDNRAKKPTTQHNSQKPASCKLAPSQQQPRQQQPRQQQPRQQQTRQQQTRQQLQTRQQQTRQQLQPRQQQQFLVVPQIPSLSVTTNTVSTSGEALHNSSDAQFQSQPSHDGGGSGGSQRGDSQLSHSSQFLYPSVVEGFGKGQ